MTTITSTIDILITEADRAEILDGRIVASGFARLAVDGERFLMTGRSGRHSLLVIATDAERLSAHWSVFAAHPLNVDDQGPEDPEGGEPVEDLDDQVEELDQGKLVVHGLPITGRTADGRDPWQAVKGGSFLISYFNRRAGDIERVIEHLGDDQILLLDNGAFSAWRKGIALDDDYFEGFEAWAQEILDRVPQAIAIIPDVIDGTPAENDRLIRETALDYDRALVVWHLDEPLDLLRHRIEGGFNYIGIGSAGAFAQVGTPAWRARMGEVFAYLDELFADADFAAAYARPWLHMLRGIGVQHAWPFDSADSTNFAINYKRQDARGETPAAFADRITAKAIEGDGYRGRYVERPAELAATVAAMTALQLTISKEETTECQNEAPAARSAIRFCGFPPPAGSSTSRSNSAAPSASSCASSPARPTPRPSAPGAPARASWPLIGAPSRPTANTLPA